MNSNMQEQLDDRSTVRSMLMALGAVYLFITGQRRSALMLGAAYAAVGAFSNLRRSETAQRLVADGGSNGAHPAAQSRTTAPSRSLFSARAGKDHVQVETRKRQSPKQSSRPNRKDDSSKSGKSGGPFGFFSAFMDKHPNVKAFATKIGKDNIGMLAAFVSWSLLTSIVPIMVGLIAISGLFLRSPSLQSNIVSHIHAGTQGTFSAKEIMALVHLSTQHTGLLGLVGFLGILWGGSNVGGSISTAFQAIFETEGRNFIKEKLIDIGMIFVFTALMLIIIAGSAAGAIITSLVKGIPVPGLVEIVGLAISLLSAFILFMSIYLVFPNIKEKLKFGNVWKGALVSAALFTLLSLIWPLYAHFQNFGKYGQLLSSILLLTAWIYFFSMITMFGAEVVSFAAIQEAHDEGEQVGPQPQDSVPQHKVLRDEPVPR